MDPLDSASAYTWQWPIDLVQYDRNPLLSEAERNVLANWRGTTGIRDNIRAALPRHCRPLEDIGALTSSQHRQQGLSRAQTMVLREVQRTQQPYWAWDQQAWLDLACPPSTNLV